MRFMNVFARASKPNKDSKPVFRGRAIEGFENKHESMQELEPLELSAICESSEEAGEKNTEVIGRSHSLCMYEEDSWQILVVKPMKKEETKSFCEVLSFWKQREKGET